MNEFSLLELSPSELKPGDEVTKFFPDSLAVSYNMLKEGFTDPLQYLHAASRPSRLPPGHYTIAVTAKFTEGETNKLLKSEIEITIS